MTTNQHLPSNSIKNRGVRKEEVVEKVKGEVVHQAKHRVRKRNTLLDLFVYEDIDNIADWIVRDVVVPTIKDIALGSIEMLFYGEVTGKRTHGRKKKDGKSYVSYSDASKRETRNETASRRARFDFDSIAWESRGEAEDVLDMLCDAIEDDGVASVGLFYDLAGIDADYTMDDYGWTDLRRAEAIKTRYGDYILNLPRPKKI